MPERHYRTCHICEAMCGLVITTEDRRITDIRADEQDVFSRGHICPKGAALRELHEDPDRKRKPLRRTKNGWQEIGWDEALAEAAERIGALQQRHGRDSIGVYYGNPTGHNHGALALVLPFIRALDTKNSFDVNSLDANPRVLACFWMYGDYTALPIPDLDRTDYMLMLGANPAASNGSAMSLGDVRGRFAQLRERGGRLVLVDPRRSETAAWADEHHFIRPGGDAALLMALLHVLFSENRVDRSAVAEIATGVSELEALTRRFTPERVANTTGISAETIRRIARDFASAKRAVAYGRVGTCLNEFGTTASWLVDALNIVTGNFDREGGVMFPDPVVELAASTRQLGLNNYDRWRSRVRGIPEFGGQLPTPCVAEEIETEGPGQIRGFVTLAGNPVLSAPNGRRLAAALERLDFMLAIDFYVNETTRHAHLILPPASALERGHYDVVFHATAVRDTVKYSKPIFPKGPDQREDWEILYELGMRLGGLRFGSKALDVALKAAWRVGYRLDPDTILDMYIRSGRWGDKFLPFGKGLNLAKVKRAQHGIDLGAMKPGRRVDKVMHPNHRVNLAPSVLVKEVPRLQAWVERVVNGEMVLIGRRHLRSNNSWLHNLHSLTKGPDRTALFVHPADAARLGVQDAQTVRARTRVGEASVKVKVTDEVMEGVVSLPHGFGHARTKDTLGIAGALGGPSLNDLTDDMRVEFISGTATLNGTPVTIELLERDGHSIG
jgi:anaerobic selenocysteine-containing dehydrogenase